MAYLLMYPYLEPVFFYKSALSVALARALYYFTSTISTRIVYDDIVYGE